MGNSDPVDLPAYTPIGPFATCPQVVHQYVTVKEAPSAETARLLHDLEKEAWSRIAKTLIQAAGENTLGLVSAKSIEMQGGLGGHRYYVCFSLNGKTHEMKFDEVDIVRMSATGPTPGPGDNRTVRWICEVIAAELVSIIGPMVMQK